MRIKVTEIEATAEELKSSNSLADGLTGMLRNAFNGFNYWHYSNSNAEEDENDEED